MAIFATTTLGVLGGLMFASACCALFGVAEMAFQQTIIGRLLLVGSIPVVELAILTVLTSRWLWLAVPRWTVVRRLSVAAMAFAIADLVIFSVPDLSGVLY